MRAVLTTALVGLTATLALAQDQPAPPAVKLLITRHNVRLDTDNYPQKTPKVALASVIQAIQAKRADYLLAQLVDPVFVDQRVKDYFSDKFDDLVKEFQAKLLDEPETLQTLQRYAKEGEWAENEGAATVKLKGTKDTVYFRKIEDRWFMENRK